MKFDERMTMQIFTRLLNTRIVANSRSTFESSFSMASDPALRRSLSFCTSVWVSEKNEVSAPEANADRESSSSVAAS